MYLMNFLFDFDQANAYFSDTQQQPPGSATSPALYTSKNWLKLNATQAYPEPASPAGYNCEPVPWSIIGDMDSAGLLITKNNITDDAGVGIRIALDPSSQGVNPITLGQGLNDAVVSLSVCFGSPSQRKQKQASPFGEPARPPVLTTFINGPAKSNQVDSTGAPISWYFPLSVVTHRPAKNRVHRYQFSVGIVVSCLSITRHFSHDPEMDVTL